MNKKAAHKAIRNFVDSRIDADDIEAISLELEGQSDRALAVIMGSFVEHALRFALESRLRSNEEHISLFENNGPLSNFSNMTNMGYALGVFGSRMRDDLVNVRYIRNAAAHAKRPFLLSIAEIKGCCDLMEISESISHGSTRESPRDWFFQSCRLLIDALNAAGTGLVSPAQEARLA